MNQLPPTDPLLPRHRIAYGAGAAAAIGAVMRVIVVPVLVGTMFDRVLVEGDFGAMGSVLVTAGLITLVGAIALWLQDSLFGRLAGTVAAEWRDRLYDSLLSRNALGRQQSSGGLASRIIADLKECEVYLQFGLGSLVAETVTVLGILTVLFVMNAQATLILILLAAPLALALNWIGKRVEQSSNRVLEKTEEVGGHLQEGLGQLEVSRAFGLRGFLRNRLKPDNQDLQIATGVRAMWAGAQTPAAQVLGFGALAALITLLIGSVQGGTMSLGELTSYITLIALLGTPLMLLPRAWAMYQQAQAAAKRLRLLMPVTQDAARSEMPLPPVAPEIRLELTAVDFSFDDSETPLFKDVNLALNGPGLVALLGESGSGKSTLMRLLLGLLQPAHGRIELDGVNLTALSDAQLRSLIAYVPQNAALFRSSLRENIDLGRGFPEERILEVLGQVGLGQLADSLPGGLDYHLAERGAGLSGGQLQRLAIARALLANPRLLLLDEPTASLDEASEVSIIELLRDEAVQRLVLVSTHRPALLAYAANVVELDGDGKFHQRSPD